MDLRPSENLLNQASRQLPESVWQNIHDMLACPRDRASLRLSQNMPLVRTAVDEQLHNLFRQLTKAQIGFVRRATIRVPGTDVEFDPFAYPTWPDNQAKVNLTLRMIPSLQCALAYIDLCEQLARLCGRDTVDACFYFCDAKEEEILKQAGIGIAWRPREMCQGHSDDLCLQPVPYTPLKSWMSIWRHTKDKAVQYLGGDGGEHYPFRITTKLYDQMRSPLILCEEEQEEDEEGNTCRRTNTRVYFGDRLPDEDYNLFSVGTNYRKIVSFTETDNRSDVIYQSPRLRDCVELRVHYNDDLAMDGMLLDFIEA